MESEPIEGSGLAKIRTNAITEHVYCLSCLLWLRLISAHMNVD